MTVDEMTVEQIEAHLQERKNAQIREIDNELRIYRNTIAELERKRAELTGDPVLVATEAPKKRAKARTVGELTTIVMEIFDKDSCPRSSGDVANLGRLSTAEARRALDALIADGRITRTGEKRGTLYHLAA